MALRFQLISEAVGSLIIEKADPIDINSLSQTIKRSKDINDGIVYEVILDVEFIKEARAYLKSAFEFSGGIDALIPVNIYDYDPNNRRWELYPSGQINFQPFEVYGKRSLPLIPSQREFQTKVPEFKRKGF